MAMNVQTISSVSDRVNEIRLLTAAIINKEILPNEQKLWNWRRDGGVDEQQREEARELRHQVQTKVKQAGLWAPHLPEEYGGCNLSFLEHAYMNEVLAYDRCGVAVRCGGAELRQPEDPAQVRHRGAEEASGWYPLTEGKMQSGFSMTEPDNAGSDPRSIKTTATPRGQRVGDQRSQVVHVERLRSGLPDRDVPHR